MLILKIILKKIKKYYFNIFQYKKYFKKQQTPAYASISKAKSITLHVRTVTLALSTSIFILNAISYIKTLHYISMYKVT